VTGALLKTMEESIRAQRNTSIRLPGLPREELALLLKALSGKDAPRSVVNEIYAETSGNPFFVEASHGCSRSRVIEDEARAMLANVYGAFIGVFLRNLNSHEN
jgi:hypothetical protein